MDAENCMPTISRAGLGLARGKARAGFAGRGPGRLLERAADQLLVWHERARQRHQLASLDAHMLRDLGLARADVEAETAKPFWRP